MISVIPLLPERYRKDTITNASWPCHKTFAVFQESNNPSEDDIKADVLADPPRKVIGVGIMKNFPTWCTHEKCGSITTLPSA